MSDGNKHVGWNIFDIFAVKNFTEEVGTFLLYKYWRYIVNACFDTKTENNSYSDPKSQHWHSIRHASIPSDMDDFRRSQFGKSCNFNKCKCWFAFSGCFSFSKCSYWLIELILLIEMPYIHKKLVNPISIDSIRHGQFSSDKQKKQQSFFTKIWEHFWPKGLPSKT